MNERGGDECWAHLIFQGHGPELDQPSSASLCWDAVNFLKFSGCSDYSHTHLLNWVTLRGNLLRKCHGCGACYRAMLFTLSSHSSGSLFVGLFCKAQPSVQLWEKSGIKHPESALTLTLISWACHFPFIWMTLILRLDLWRKLCIHRTQVHMLQVLQKGKNIRLLSLLNQMHLKLLQRIKENAHDIGRSCGSSLHCTKVKTDPSVGNLSSGALRIPFAGWRGK